MVRSRLLRFAALPILFAGLTILPAHAANKDMIQLQTQVQQLIDAVARLQQTNDESMGVLKDLVQQTADSVNKMSVTVNGMGLKLQNEQDAAATQNTQLSGQIQSLNDSLDELRARLDKMQTALTNIQSQQQTTAAALTNMTPPAGSPIPAGAPTDNSAPADTAAPAQTPGGATSPDDQANPAPPSGGATLPPTADVGGPAVPMPAAAAPASGDMYSTAYNDYIAGRYPLASSEFDQLIKAYPDDNLSGNAYFYLGEIDMRTQKPSAAVKNYDHVLEHYPANAKIPAAELHKGEALIDIHQDEAGVREFRELIQRYPVSPEAKQARSKLNGMGVRIRE